MTVVRITQESLFGNGDDNICEVKREAEAWPEVLTMCFDTMRGLGFMIEYTADEIMDAIDWLRASKASKDEEGYDGV